MHLVHERLPTLVQSGGWLALAVYLAFSFLVAFVLYMAVERPFLGLRARISSRVVTPVESTLTAG
jgi:peptidoglycan/LPS O-acetylase OafA/YrhL